MWPQPSLKVFHFLNTWNLSISYAYGSVVRTNKLNSKVQQMRQFKPKLNLALIPLACDENAW